MNSIESYQNRIAEGFQLKISSGNADKDFSGKCRDDFPYLRSPVFVLTCEISCSLVARSMFLLLLLLFVTCLFVCCLLVANLQQVIRACADKVQDILFLHHPHSLPLPPPSLPH